MRKQGRPNFFSAPRFLCSPCCSMGATFAPGEPLRIDIMTRCPVRARHWPALTRPNQDSVLSWMMQQGGPKAPCGPIPANDEPHPSPTSYTWRALSDIAPRRQTPLTSPAPVAFYNTGQMRERPSVRGQGSGWPGTKGRWDCPGGTGQPRDMSAENCARYSQAALRMGSSPAGRLA